MDEIQTRLQETSKNCLQAYEGWLSSKKNASSRETLLTAIHELRKVASRLEIELAVSERNEMTSRPLPIPAHRSSLESGNGDGDDNPGNGDSQSGGGEGGRPRRRRTGPRKPQGGGA